MFKLRENVRYLSEPAQMGREQTSAFSAKTNSLALGDVNVSACVITWLLARPVSPSSTRRRRVDYATQGADKMPTSEMVETMPMLTGADGVIRVSGTRVTLDSILLAFNDGETPEEIAQQYPSVPLADIYHLIGYHLRHAAETEAYLRRRQRESEKVRRENEARSSPDGVRRRLLARQPKGA